MVSTSSLEPLLVFYTGGHYKSVSTQTLHDIVLAQIHTLAENSLPAVIPTSAASHSINPKHHALNRVITGLGQADVKRSKDDKGTMTRALEQKPMQKIRTNAGVIFLARRSPIFLRFLAKIRPTIQNLQLPN